MSQKILFKWSKETKSTNKAVSILVRFQSSYECSHLSGLADRIGRTSKSFDCRRKISHDPTHSPQKFSNAGLTHRSGSRIIIQGIVNVESQNSLQPNLTCLGRPKNRAPLLSSKHSSCLRISFSQSTLAQTQAISNVPNQTRHWCEETRQYS